MTLGDVPVEDQERLARMVFSERHLQKTNGIVTLKAEAFLPYKHVELSVIRHRDLSEENLWQIGNHVAAKRGKTLIGRGDIFARDARAQNLDVVPAEGPEMPRNHADIRGWPPEKPAQMLRAVELAAVAAFVAPG